VTTWPEESKTRNGQCVTQAACSCQFTSIQATSIAWAMADDEPANRSDSFACSYRLRSSARFFGQAGSLVIRPQPVVSNFKIRPAGAARPTTRGRNRITARDCSCNQAGCTIPSQLDRILVLRSIGGEHGRIGGHGRIAVTEGVLNAICRGSREEAKSEGDRYGAQEPEDADREFRGQGPLRYCFAH
jgi:hypothetical protein